MVFDHKPLQRYFPDGSRPCFTGQHLGGTIGAAFSILIIILASLMVFLLANRASAQLLSRFRYVDNLINAMQYKLKDGCKWWLGWELLRRLILSMLDWVPLLAGMPWWTKEALIQAFMIFNLLLHIKFFPYKPVNRSERSTDKFWQQMRSIRRPSDIWHLKNVQLWNVLEGIVLGIMVVLTLFTTTSSRGGIPNEEQWRTVLLGVLVGMTLTVGYLVLVVILVRKVWKRFKKTSPANFLHLRVLQPNPGNCDPQKRFIAESCSSDGLGTGGPTPSQMHDDYPSPN